MNTESFGLLVTALEGLTAKQRLVVAGRVRVLSERADSARLIVKRVDLPLSVPTALAWT
jgi:hypothetical protein